MNEVERPRILVLTGKRLTERFQFLKTSIGSLRFIQDLADVDPTEWDILVTDRQPTHATSHSASLVSSERPISWFRREVPLGLHVFFVQTEEFTTSQSSVMDVATVGDDELRNLKFVLHERLNVSGSKALRVDGLPSSIQELVVRDLAPAAARMSKQFGHSISPHEAGNDLQSIGYLPFLLGPSDLVYACRYWRAEKSSIWMVPEDVHDLEPWFEVASQYWHEVDPDRIPGRPRWFESMEWHSHSEQKIMDEIQTENSEFARVLAGHDESVGALTVALAEEQKAVDLGARQLLVGQSDPLQNAAFQALQDLGFNVEDMDLVWDPKQRREDFRIADPEDDAWFAIADATGTTKGVKGNKLSVLADYVTKYVFEEKPKTIPVRWLIANHFIERDPNTRGPLLRADDLNVFVESGGLAIETTALFTLQRACNIDGGLKQPLRDHLKTLSGQFCLQEARNWLEGRDVGIAD